jgi:hypothetical protein
VCDEFLQDAVILQEDARAFTGAPLEVQLEMFPCFAANVAALDRLLGPLTAPCTAADAERAAERRHLELMEEVRRGQRDLADLLLEHLHCLLAQALPPLGVAVLHVAPVPSASAHAVDDNEEEEEDDKEEKEE